MEININNALPLIIKISYRPFLPGIDGLSQIIQESSRKLITSILENPLLCTLVATCLLIILFSILSISFIVMTLVFCILSCILLFEGFILAVILILAVVFTLMAMGIFTILQGLKLMYVKK